jgi:hypothetical protein
MPGLGKSGISRIRSRSASADIGIGSSLGSMVGRTVARRMVEGRDAGRKSTAGVASFRGS